MVQRHCSEIIEKKLYLGNIQDAKKKPKLLDLGIKNILNCTVEVPNMFPDDFTYLRLDMRDEIKEEIGEHVEVGCKFIGSFFYSQVNSI